MTAMSVTCWPPEIEVAEVVKASVVGLSWTVWIRGAAELAISKPSPPYTARNVWVPTANEGIEMVAEPVTSSAPTPITVESCVKVTSPVALWVDPLVTVAEMTTGLRVRSGF
jgi:hypothetical protein